MGMILGFIALMGLIALTAWAIYQKEPWVATVLIAMITVCGIMARGGKKENK